MQPTIGEWESCSSLSVEIVTGFKISIAWKTKALEPFTWDMFWLFWKNPKKGDFVLRFSPWKKHQQKKQSTPQRRARKNEDYHHIRFLCSSSWCTLFFMEKITKQNRLFSDFFKKAKSCLMKMALATSFFKLWGF